MILMLQEKSWITDRILFVGKILLLTIFTDRYHMSLITDVNFYNKINICQFINGFIDE